MRALLLHPVGFYASMIAGSVNSLSAVGMRAHLSRIVEPMEQGKVFSLMSLIDAVTPLIASSLFTSIFAATMDTMPGMAFLVIAAMLMIPIFVMFWIDIYTVVPDLGQNRKDIDFTVEDKASDKIAVDL